MGQSSTRIQSIGKEKEREGRRKEKRNRLTERESVGQARTVTAGAIPTHNLSMSQDRLQTT